MQAFKAYGRSILVSYSKYKTKKAGTLKIRDLFFTKQPLTQEVFLP